MNRKLNNSTKAFLCPHLKSGRHIALLLSVRKSRNLVRSITKDFLNLGSPNLVWGLVMTSARTLSTLRSLGQRSRSQWPWRQKACPTDNWKTLWPTVFKLGMGVGHDLCKNPIDFEVIRSKVKVTVTLNIEYLKLMLLRILNAFQYFWLFHLQHSA